MSGYVSCAKLDEELETKQDALLNCAGAPLAGNVPTCAEMNAAIDAAETPETPETPDATSVLRGKVELATVSETIAGTDSERAVTPEGVKAAVDAGIAAALAGMQDVFEL